MIRVNKNIKGLKIMNQMIKLLGPTVRVRYFGNCPR